MIRDRRMRYGGVWVALEIPTVRGVDGNSYQIFAWMIQGYYE